MFHLINKAWVDILARQLRDKKINLVLCACTNEKEMKIVDDIIEKYDIKYQMLPIAAGYIKDIMDSEEIAVFDDILISHDLNDIYVKDFLAKHCKRINKNL